MRTTSLTPFSATLAWKTTQPARAWASYGIKDAGATLWTPADDTSVDHQATLSGLTFGRAYTVTLFASGSGEKAELTLDVTTPPLPAKVSASTDGGRLLLDGQPFFPLMVWGQCPAGYAPVLAAGIDLFGGNPCSGTQRQLDALGGSVLSAGAIEEGTGDGPGLIGWYYPDEADLKHFTGASLPSLPLAPGQVSFLTVTSHFYSGADPPSEGRSIYPGLVERADVVGFDLYPLQDWCRTDRIAAVYQAQRELVQLAAGKPTFQWIESGGMLCDFPPFSITPDTVRAESWLAIAGGAHGLGFFPGWSQEVGQQVTLIGREVKALGPALLSPDAPVSVKPTGGPMIVAARGYNGALYVIAVNPGSGPIQAKIKAPGLDGRTLLVLDEYRTVQADGDTFSDDFPPLATHVYIAPPSVE